MVYRYSHLREKLFRITYNYLGVKLKGMLQVCGGCARSKEKACAVRKKTYTRASKPRENIFCGHDWSISGEFDWEFVLDRRSIFLQPLFVELFYQDQVATTK